MKSRLLSRRDLEDLAGAGSLRALVAALAKTPYRRTLEAALVQLTDREAVLAALRADFEETATNLRRFYNGNAAVRVQLILRQYDVHNLKTVLRGLSSHAAPGEILAALLPVGMLTRDVLAEYLSAFDPRITGLTGTPEAVAKIVMGYRVFARKVPLDSGGYLMDHTAAIYLLDSDGTLTGTIDYQEDPDTALKKLRRLVDSS